MDNQEYISIKEFAARANVSTQSIYKKLNQVDNKLQTYCKQVDNQKMLNIKALQDLYNIKVDKDMQQDTTLSQQLIEILQEQLRVKDEQIASLNNTLEQTAAALKASQALQANTERKLIELESKELEEPRAAEPTKRHWWNIFK